MLFEKILEAMKDGEANMAVSILCKDPKGMAKYDKATGMRLLYWAVVTQTKWAGACQPFSQSCSSLLSSQHEMPSCQSRALSVFRRQACS